MPHPTLVVLDVNETLTDLSPLRERLAAVGAPGHVLGTWFASVLRDGFALTAAGSYAPFAALAVDALRAILAAQGADPSGAEHVVEGFATLPLHPDVEPGLRRLREAGVRVVTLTNGSTDVTEGVLAAAGLRPLVEHVLSVDAVGRWKPAPEAYAYALSTCGVAADETALVAVHPWDVDGAVRAGLTGAWIRRSATPYPGWARKPSVTGAGLDAVAQALLT